MSKPNCKSFTSAKLSKMGMNRGGSVKEPDRDDGMSMRRSSHDEPDMDDAPAARSRMDRAGYKRGGAVKGKTTVNVIVGGPKSADQPTPTPVPVPVPAGGPAPAPMPAPHPPMSMPPPGAAPGPMPPMPMRARGGAVKMKAGAGSGEGRMQKADKAD